jgi:hypothetical protein
VQRCGNHATGNWEVIRYHCNTHPQTNALPNSRLQWLQWSPHTQLLDVAWCSAVLAVVEL